MEARRSMQKNFDHLRSQQDMGSQPAKAPGPNASFDRSYPARPASTTGIERKRAASLSWHGPLTNREPPHGERRRVGPPREGHHVGAESRLPSTDIPEQLAQLIMTMFPGVEGKELADAFQHAPELPPITKHSLSELDIHNIIGNIKLRHDVSFDRDLSFRPNLDGLKGHEKAKSAQRYWKALVAELELYTRLFRGTLPLQDLDVTNWPTVVHHAERRIPKIFQTIQDVLKTLVPERDHSRVDEHLDVPMLMQEIERGVCDLVRLAEWMAYLLKEHCAPMRDVWVDKMVSYTRTGVHENSAESIVKGLCELLGILESMKLDVANHQIRNLKSLLIEDTVNFESHYHLDRLVANRSRINIPAAQKWYQSTLASLPPQSYAKPLPLPTFARAVTTTLFATGPAAAFPETFYLDSERLRLIAAELQDAVAESICANMLSTTLARQNHAPPTPPQALACRTTLRALLDSSSPHGLLAWTRAAPALALEISRHAARIARTPFSPDHAVLYAATEELCQALRDGWSAHAERVREAMEKRVLDVVDKYRNVGAMEMFERLVPTSASGPSSGVGVLGADGTNEIIDGEVGAGTGLPGRIAHVVLLHWRVWGAIAYEPVESEAKVAL